jgi:hypothetical protein
MCLKINEITNWSRGPLVSRKHRLTGRTGRSPVATAPHGVVLTRSCMAQQRGLVSHFRSSTCTLRSAPLSTTAHHSARCQAPPPRTSSTVEPTRRITVYSSSCGNWLQPESPVSDAGSHCSPSSSSSRSSPSTAIPIDLQPNQEYCELPLHALLLTDPKFRSGSLSSAPPTTASPPLSSSSSGRLPR